MINSFKDTLIYSTCFYSCVFDSEGLQIYYFSITIAPTLSAAARAAAEKHLQDIHKQELKNHKQKHTYKVALNQATFKAFAASIA